MEIVKFLVEEKGVSINCTNNKQENGLWLAVSENNIKVVEYLLPLHIDKENKNILELSPLNLAYSKNYIKIAKLLLIYGCDIKKNNCLINAVFSNNIELLKLFNVFDVIIEHKNEDNLTALVIACFNYNLYSIKYLIEELYANVLVIDNKQNDLLMIASQYNNLNIFNYLLAKMIEKKYDINKKNIYGDTVLLINVELNKQLFVESLINNGECCLTIATRKGYIEMVRYFINKYSKISKNIVETSNKSKNTLLLLAAKHNHIDIMKYLLKKGAVIDARNRDGLETSLHYAVKNNNLEMVKLLVENNCKIDVLDFNPYSPLLIASIRGYTSIFN